MTFAVYRLYEASGAALYVGCSGDVHMRLRSHETSKDWWRDVARVDITLHGDKRTALDVEAGEIQRLRPAHNVMHHPSTETWAPKLRLASDQLGCDARAWVMAQRDAGVTLRRVADLLHHRTGLRLSHEGVRLWIIDYEEEMLQRVEVPA